MKKPFYIPNILKRFRSSPYVNFCFFLFSSLVPKNRYIFCYSILLLNLYSTIFVQFQRSLHLSESLKYLFSFVCTEVIFLLFNFKINAALITTYFNQEYLYILFSFYFRRQRQTKLTVFKSSYQFHTRPQLIKRLHRGNVKRAQDISYNGLLLKNSKPLAQKTKRIQSK